MKQLTDDLWQTTIHTSGILSSHAYYLTTPVGNVLLYNTNNTQDLDEIAALGGIDYQLLTHRDEAAPSLQYIKDRFSATLVCSKFEQPYIEKHARVELALDDDLPDIANINILSTPGHTGGSLCFYYQSPNGNNYLFTGDTIFQWQGEWATLVIAGAGGKASDLIDSLTLLKTLRPHFVMSSGFIKNDAIGRITPAQWPDVVNNTIDKLAN